LEQVVRSEVASAYARYEAASRAVRTYETGVIGNSTANVDSFRAAYQLGEYRVTDLLAEQRRLLDTPRLKEALAAADRGRLAEYRGKADDAARAFFAPRPQ
jgi:cobalt-zinc-cadmium efflux system outer membrane protein